MGILHRCIYIFRRCVNATPEAETRLCHLMGVLLQAENSNAVFHLWANPQQNDTVTAAWYGVTQASFTSCDKRYYADFSYAYSHYQNKLHVQQYTPTVGLGLFEGDGWWQLRGYFIETSNPDRAQGLSSNQAADIKYTYWLTPDG